MLHPLKHLRIGKFEWAFIVFLTFQAAAWIIEKVNNLEISVKKL